MECGVFTRAFLRERSMRQPAGVHGANFGNLQKRCEVIQHHLLNHPRAVQQGWA